MGSRRRGGAGEKITPKRKEKRRWRRRRRGCEGEQKRSGGPWCGPQTHRPEQAKSLAPYPSFVAVLEICQCKTPFWTFKKLQTTRQGTPLCLPSPPLPLASLAFYPYPFSISLIFRPPFPTPPCSPHPPSQQNKSTSSPIDLLPLCIQRVEQARRTMFFLLGHHAAR